MSRKKRRQSTIKSVADQFQSIPNTSSWTFSSLVNPQDLSVKAAYDFQSIPNTSSWTFSALKTSGYQVVLGVFSDQTVPVSDGLNLADTSVPALSYANSDALSFDDSATASLRVLNDDPLNLSDTASADTPGLEFLSNDDPLNLIDTQALAVQIDRSEPLNLSDSVIQNIVLGISDPLNLNDISSGSYSISVSDSMNLTDSARAGVGIAVSDSFSFDDSVAFRKRFHKQYSTAVQVAHKHQIRYSTEVQVQHYAPAPINDLLAPTNPALPTLVQNGSYLVQNGATDKGAVGSYISIDESALAPACDLVRASLNYQLGGGTFSITCKSNFTILGAVFELFGIPVLVTEIEDEESDEGTLYTVSGLVGNQRGINQEIMLVLNTTNLIGLRPLFPNTILQSAPSIQWTTISQAARAIASYANISLIWNAIDAPLIDTFLETGMTILSALQSLASRVGAFLTFDGQNWIVIPPDQGYGAWNPNHGSGCGMWNKGGLKVKRRLDLQGTGITIPLDPVASSSVKFIDNPLTNPPPPVVEEIRSFSQKPKVDKLIPIPGDNKSGLSSGTPYNAWVQILLPTKDGKTVGNTYVPGTQLADGVTMVPNGTTDPNKWFPISYGQFPDNKGVHNWVLTPSHFDEDLDDGNFTYKIGYTKNTDPLLNAYQSQQQEIQQRQRLYAQYQQQKYRYFPTAVGTASFGFFGSLPIPGNNVSFTFNTKSISGIVTSVAVTFSPGSLPQLQVGVTKFQRINLLQPTAILDYYLATGGTGVGP